ncbi:lysylphosphatidylglycerol synthase transmembrane domain-containing protein [Calditrichota bacterium GD2]
MRHVQNILKIIISLGLLGYLIYRAEPARLISVLSNITEKDGVAFLVAAFLLMLLAVFFLALRWRVLLKSYGFHLKTSQLFGFYLIGMFFNNFLPTSIGGDIMRIYKLISVTDDRTSAFASVIIERLMGIAATLLMSIFALIYISQQFHDNRLLIVAVVMFLAIMVFFTLILKDRSFNIILKIFDRFTIFKIGQKFNKLFEAIHLFQEKRMVLMEVFMLSFISQFFIVSMNYLVAVAFSIPVSFGYLLMVVPISFVLTMLPSINGIGIRDLGFVGLLAQVGISTAEALTLSFMNLIIPMLISTAGGLLFMLQKNKAIPGGENVFDAKI